MCGLRVLTIQRFQLNRGVVYAECVLNLLFNRVQQCVMIRRAIDHDVRRERE
jgi:hypothetical protein